MTPTSRVVLGMIRLGRRTGYEIKQLVDVSARFFWTASYGQLYPELKRLEEDGLIRGEDAASGGRRRRAYELTPEGERALDDWLRSDRPLLFETRDEGLLKLFFSDRLDADEKRALFEAMRDRHDEIVTSLESTEPMAREKGGGPYDVLRFGLAYHRFCSEQLDQMRQEVK
jgi:PadR family transcriptional regulator, regulatory protein AphA